MAGNRLRPFLLKPTPGRKTTKQNRNMAEYRRSINNDFHPVQQDVLAIPSPYHDNFSTPNTPHLDAQALPSTSIRFSDLPFFNHLRYAKASRSDDMEIQTPGEENAWGLGEEKSGAHGERMKRRKMQAGFWLTVCVLLLLFSVLFNVFFMFSGVTGYMHGYERVKGGIRHRAGGKGIGPLT